MPHPEGFKSRMIQRMTGPQAITARALSREVGIGRSTLGRWRDEARRLSGMGRQENTSSPSPGPKGPRSWSAEEKYRIVIEAAAVTETELGEFLRTKGLHAAQLEEWRRAAAEGAKAALGSGGKPRTPADKTDKKRIRELEREVHRKDKALAEATALLVLKKKLDLLLGDEDESTPTKSAT